MTFTDAPADGWQDTHPNWVRIPDAADRAGITYRQLDSWIRAGHIRADDARPGSGHQRHLHTNEVAVLKHMALLVRHGLRPVDAVTYARQIVATGHARIGMYVLTPNTLETRSTT